VFVFDAQKIIQTVEDPQFASQLQQTPVDELRVPDPDPVVSAQKSAALTYTIDVRTNYTIQPGYNLAQGNFTFGLPTTTHPTRDRLQERSAGDRPVHAPAENRSPDWSAPVLCAELPHR